MPPSESAAPKASTHPTLDAAAAAWPLLTGMACLMIAAGLQGSLLGVRASLEGFPTLVTGVIMSGYYAGFFAGSLLTPGIVQRVGHVRVFAALASIASVAVLVHSLLVEPVTWIAVRATTGFSYAGLYVVAESWLNERSGNQTRGRLLSIYMLTQFGGLAGGQLLLSTGDPGGFTLFILASIAVSIALVPILLSARPAPAFEAPSPLGLKDLFHVSPLGFLGALGSGLVQGAYSGMGAVYAATLGLSIGSISLFMASVTIGGAVLQWPVGHLSDRIGRRRVIIFVTFAGALACVGAALVGDRSLAALIAAAVVFGGLALPLYALSVAQTNDYLRADQMVAASSGLILLYGTGSIFGPIASSAAMSLVGPDGFFWYLALVMAVLGLFTVYRMTVRPAKPVDEQTRYAPAIPRRSPLAAVFRRHGRAPKG